MRYTDSPTPVRPAQSPADQTVRLTALRRLAILDTPPETAFDNLTRVAATLCDTPIALISFLDADRQWCKARCGWDGDTLPLASSLGGETLRTQDVVIVSDLSSDRRFAQHPFVALHPHVRFYTAVPLMGQTIGRAAGSTVAVGTLTVMDRQARSLTQAQIDGLRLIADQVMATLELRRWGTVEASRERSLEVALHHSEAFYHSLVESLPQHIIRKDLQGRFTFANDRFCAMVGHPFSEVVGKTDADFFPPELASKYQADDRRVIHSGEKYEAIESHRAAEGTMHVQVVKTPVTDASGAIIGIQCLFWDISERMRMEEDLARARDAALESARLKSEFLANMSHEIRTPLNAVVGMSGLLLDTGLNAEQRDFADTIRTSADLLLGIINDILDFSKIEAGRMTIEVVDFDLTQVIEETADLLAERAQSKGVELVTWTPPDVPHLVTGDPGRLRQVLANLLSNAVKFTEAGEVVLKVGVVDEDATTARFRIEVRDTGIGIPLATQPSLFTAFTQADGSMTRRYGGTGLGLAICRQLITLMGGEIGLVSAPGAGSTFWIELPLGKQATPSARPVTEPASLEGARVLIVDDNATNREILRHQLAAWRLRTTSVASGTEALDALRKEAAGGDAYQLAILDMQMPEMDGMAVARAIKGDARLKTTRLIVLTSLAYHPEESELGRLGVAAYMAKPVKQSKLFDSLATAMRDRPDGASSGPRTARADAESRLANLPTRGLRVLLAEDNTVNQRVALRQLSKLGITADPVGNGLEALAAIRQAPYSIILMDCQMPEMDGYEATRRIRQMEREHPDSPRHFVIALTAHALDGDRQRCLDAGMDEYISKPIRLDELARVLERCLPAAANTAVGAASTMA